MSRRLVKAIAIRNQALALMAASNRMLKVADIGELTLALMAGSGEWRFGSFVARLTSQEATDRPAYIHVMRILFAGQLVFAVESNARGQARIISYVPGAWEGMLKALRPAVTPEPSRAGPQASGQLPA